MRLFAPLCLATTLLAAAAALAASPEPGTRLQVDIRHLPPPGAGKAAAEPPHIVPRPQGTLLHVPKGYGVTLYAEGITNARNLLALPDGSLLVAQSRLGRLLRLVGPGQAQPFADGFSYPFGLAWHDGDVWVADLNGVWRMPWSPGQDTPGPRRQVTEAGALGSPDGHITRSLAIAPDGDSFFVGIGSMTNLDVEPPPRATIQQFDIRGGGKHTFAGGLRNPVGLAFRPGTNELWTVVNERDAQGDDMVPDYLTRVVEDGFYGWPYAWLGPHPQPGLASHAPDKVAATRTPDLLFHAHSAPLGLAFWHGDAFVALHGSWNSSVPQGYFLARIPFRRGRPAGWYEAFATGFLLGQKNGQPQVWGRPVGLAVGRDDALYVCDDASGTVWRIVKE